MAEKTSRPAPLQSAGRKAKLDVPGRKIDNGKYISLDLDSKGMSGVCGVVRERDIISLDGGFCVHYAYIDANFNVISPAFRVYSDRMGEGARFEIIPAEDAVLFSAPLQHDREKCGVALYKNVLARTEWRRKYRETFIGTCQSLGFDTEQELESFLTYLCLIEEDDHKALCSFGFDPAVAIDPGEYRDPTLTLADWRSWWRAPA